MCVRVYVAMFSFLIVVFVNSRCVVLYMFVL